jgi:hypothetical protein
LVAADEKSVATRTFLITTGWVVSTFSLTGCAALAQFDPTFDAAFDDTFDDIFFLLRSHSLLSDSSLVSSLTAPSSKRNAAAHTLV